VVPVFTLQRQVDTVSTFYFRLIASKADCRETEGSKHFLVTSYLRQILPYTAGQLACQQSISFGLADQFCSFYQRYGQSKKLLSRLRVDKPMA